MVFWRYSVWVDGPTPGGQLQNLRYARASGGGAAPAPLRRGQKLGLLVVGTLLPWLATRLRDLADTPEAGLRWPRWAPLARWYLRAVAPRLTAIYATCAALNF